MIWQEFWFVLFFMVLINGFNLIDGTNCLCSLNLFLILTFIFLLINTLNINYLNTELKILLIPLSIFLIFNFFGYNFLGDGAAYGLGFLIGYILVKFPWLIILFHPILLLIYFGTQHLKIYFQFLEEIFKNK